MDEELNTFASDIMIFNHSRTVQQNTPSSTATLQKEKETLLVETIELGHMEKPKYDGTFQDELFSKAAPAFPSASEAIFAASIPLPESPIQNNQEERVTTSCAGIPMDREILCTEGSCEVSKNSSVVEESTSPQQPVSNSEAEMQDPLKQPQVEFDEHVKTLAKEGSKSQGFGDAQTAENILNGGCSDMQLLKRRNHVGSLGSHVYSATNSDDLGNSQLLSADDPSEVNGEQTASLYNDTNQNNNGPHARANATRLVIVNSPSAVPQIFETGIENALDAEPEAVASINIEGSRVANAEILISGIVDGRPINIETVDVPPATALHCQESRSCTTAKMEIMTKIIVSQDVIDSAIRLQRPQTISPDCLELQIIEPMDFKYPAAMEADLGSFNITAAESKPHTVEHDLGDIAVISRVAVDDTPSSNEKFEEEKSGEETKADRAVELISRTQNFLLSEEVGKSGFGTSSNGKPGDIPENLAVSTTSKDETVTPNPPSKLNRKQEPYNRRLIERLKKKRYARKMAAQQAALEISNRTSPPQHHQEPEAKNPTAKESDTGSNRGYVPPKIRGMFIDKLIVNNWTQPNVPSIASSEGYLARSRRFREVREILLKNSQTAQSNIGACVDEGSDRKGLKASRNDGINEVDGVKKYTQASDDIVNVPLQSEMVIITRGVRGVSDRYRQVKGVNDILKDKERNSREQRGDSLGVGQQSQCAERPAQGYKDHKTDTPTPVKPELGAGVDGVAGQASESVKHGLQQRSMVAMRSRCAGEMGDGEEGEVVGNGIVPTRRRWKKVRRVVAGSDNRNQRPEDKVYARRSPHPPLPVRVPIPVPVPAEPSIPSIPSRQHQPLKVHDPDVMNDSHSQSPNRILHSFHLNPTSNPRQNPSQSRRLSDSKMSLDGVGRTARGPRGRAPGRRGLKYNPHFSVHHQPINEFRVEPMNGAPRHRPSFQPQSQSRESDSHQWPIYGVASGHHTARNQPFPCPSPSNPTSPDNGFRTMTNQPDSITKSGTHSGTKMATITARTDVGDGHSHNTPRLQTRPWSQTKFTEIAHTNNPPAGADVKVNADVNATATANDQAKVDGGLIPRKDYPSSTNGKDGSAHNMQQSHITDTTATGTGTGIGTGNNTANVSGSSINNTPNRLDGGPTTPINNSSNGYKNNRESHNTNNTNNTNHTNNSNPSINGCFREPGLGPGSSKMGKSTRKSRLATSSAGPPLPDLHEPPPSIVPDGTWDASSATFDANAVEPPSLGYRITLKAVPKYNFAEAGRQIMINNPPIIQSGSNAPTTSQTHAMMLNNSPIVPRAQTTEKSPIHRSHPHTTPNKTIVGSNAHTTAVKPSSPAQAAPAQHPPTQDSLARHAHAPPPPAQHAPAARGPVQPAAAQQAPTTEASVVLSASSDRPNQVRKPKTLAKTNGVWLPPHLRAPVPKIPIQPSRKIIEAKPAEPAEPDRNACMNSNGDSPNANPIACANANDTSAKANPSQTSVIASAPVNADVSSGKEKPVEVNPGTLSNTDVSTAKDKPIEANPSALSNADASTIKDKPPEANPNVDVSNAMDKSSEAIPSALSNANGAREKREPVESSPSAAVETHVSNARFEVVEPNSSSSLQPDVSNILPPIQPISKGKQPELAVFDNVPTPPVSLSNVSVNSRTSITGRRATKKDTLDFEHPLAGWDGNWGPAPVEWGGRPSFDHRDTQHIKFVHDWLHDRARDSLNNPLLVNITDDGFLTGKALANGETVFGIPIDDSLHVTFLPDDDFTKAKHLECAADALKKHRSKIKVERQETKAERRAFRQAMREAQASYALLPNPHTPQANIYIRPAESRDLKQITEIYNHYIEHSVVVAERTALTEQQWRGRWMDATESNYAFLVAVQHSSKGGGHNRRTSHETICGFAYADDFGDVSNAWRYTCELQCYVGNWNLRMGVGKSLIDRMMGALDPIYVVRAGTKFEGGATPIRYEGGGVRVVNKVVINIPYAVKDENTLKWQKEWLAQFQFEHVGTLPGIGRKFDKVVNLAMLMMETGSVLPGGRL
ncbi:hypothetical protein MMC29_005610 [Sticta canariensis]|nr:hypothetical protein [Sticta canariensis]